MKKPYVPSSRKLVYVHGTNGSGKSTLARAVIASAGGVAVVETIPGHKKAHLTVSRAGPVFVGRYGTACGGADGLHPYASIFDAVASSEAHVFAEGLITPGVETCRRLAGMAEEHLFIVLDVPPEQCVTNVLKRRARKGTDKPYNPDNLYRKHRSALSWGDRLDSAGLQTARLSWTEAYARVLGMLSLPFPDVTTLLED